MDANDGDTAFQTGFAARGRMFRSLQQCALGGGIGPPGPGVAGLKRRRLVPKCPYGAQQSAGTPVAPPARPRAFTPIPARTLLS